MIERINEIEEFFSKNTFTEEELNLLKKRLKSCYPNKQDFNKIQSIINLKLIHYKIDGPVKPLFDTSKKNNDHNLLITNKRRRLKDRKRAKNKNTDLISREKIITLFENKPYETLAFALEVPVQQLVGKKKRQEKGWENKISKEYLESRMPFILGRINKIKSSFNGKRVKKPLNKKKPGYKKVPYSSAHKGMKIIYTKM